jgi:hypothetical protein
MTTWIAKELRVNDAPRAMTSCRASAFSRTWLSRFSGPSLWGA